MTNKEIFEFLLKNRGDLQPILPWSVLTNRANSVVVLLNDVPVVRIIETGDNAEADARFEKWLEPAEKDLVIRAMDNMVQNVLERRTEKLGALKAAMSDMIQRGE